MIDTRAIGDTCPECGTATVAPREALPWCPACEWNLKAYDAERIGPFFGWRWLDRRIHDIGYRMTRRQCDRLLGRSLGSSGVGAAAVVTATASCLLFLGVVALAVTGIWLLLAFSFPSPSLLLAVPLLALAVGLRPRFGRLDPDADVLRRDRAPELFALVDEVAQAVGAPAPDVVAVNADFNAYAATIGIRRRVLCLGLPYWGSLAPQERVALLGHELGHFVNGDPRRMLLTQPAFTTLGSAADLLRPAPSTAPGLIEWIGAALGRVIQYPLSRLLFVLHVALVCVALRDSQRAEYLADEMSAKAAGTAAATSLLDATLRVESMSLAVRRESRAGHGPQRWQAAVAESLAASADQLPLLRQLSGREEASLFSSHPPTGRRHLMLEGVERHDPAVVLTQQRSSRIDDELTKEYESARRVLAW